MAVTLPVVFANGAVGKTGNVESGAGLGAEGAVMRAGSGVVPEAESESLAVTFPNGATGEPEAVSVRTPLCVAGRDPMGGVPAVIFPGKPTGEDCPNGGNVGLGLALSGIPENEGGPVVAFWRPGTMMPGGCVALVGALDRMTAADPAGGRPCVSLVGNGGTEEVDVRLAKAGAGATGPVPLGGALDVPLTGNGGRAAEVASEGGVLDVTPAGAGNGEVLGPAAVGLDVALTGKGGATKGGATKGNGDGADAGGVDPEGATGEITVPLAAGKGANGGVLAAGTPDDE